MSCCFYAVASSPDSSHLLDEIVAEVIVLELPGKMFSFGFLLFTFWGGSRLKP